MIINSEIESRYMMGMRLFLLFGFIYGISLVNTVYQIVAKKITKHNNEFSFNGKERDLQNDITGRHDETRLLTYEKTNLQLSTYFTYVFVAFILSMFAYSMWDSSVRFYENEAAQIKPYNDAAHWLAANLGSNQKIFLPQKEAFWAIEPSLKDQTYSYKSIWQSLGYFVKEDTTQEQILEVQNSLKSFIHDPANKVKYLVFDWVDRHGKWAAGITDNDLEKNLEVCKKFDQSLNEIKRYNFREPYSNWGSSMVICEIS